MAGSLVYQRLEAVAAAALQSPGYPGPAPSLGHIHTQLDLPIGTDNLSHELDRQEFKGDGNLYEVVAVVLRRRPLHGCNLPFLNASMIVLSCNATLSSIMLRGGLGYPGVPEPTSLKRLKKLADLFEALISRHQYEASYAVLVETVEQTFGYVIDALEAEFSHQLRTRPKRAREPEEKVDSGASRRKRRRTTGYSVPDENTRPSSRSTKSSKKRARNSGDHIDRASKRPRTAGALTTDVNIYPANNSTISKAENTPLTVSVINMQPSSVSTTTSSSRNGPYAAAQECTGEIQSLLPHHDIHSGPSVSLCPSSDVDHDPLLSYTLQALGSSTAVQVGSSSSRHGGSPRESLGLAFSSYSSYRRRGYSDDDFKGSSSSRNEDRDGHDGDSCHRESF